MKTKPNKVKDFFKKVDAFFNKINEAFLSFFRKHYLLIAFILIVALSLTVRLVFLPFVSGDMNHFLLPWFNYLREFGGFKALKTYPWVGSGISKPGDYPVAYINLLALLSYIPGNPITLIKISSILFDYVLAIGAVLIIREFNKNNFLSLIAFAAFVFFPTSILNSAIWGQSDQMYVALVVWTVWLLLRKHPVLAMIPLGFAISIKLQSVFFLPVLIYMWLAKEFKLRNMLIIFLVIFSTFLPSYLAGAQFAMPFKMYYEQITSIYSNANYGAGSMYAFFEMAKFKDGINKGGVFLAFTFIGIALLILYHYQVPATKKNLVFVSVLFSLLSPFVLPHMHERYFYMADVFLIIYVIVYRRKYLFAALMSFSSVITYTHFLTGEYIFKFLGTDSVRLAALINLGLLIGLIFEAPKVLEKAPLLVSEELAINKEED